MKKIFTLLFTIGTVGIASAQSTAHHDNKFDSKPVTFSNHGSNDQHGNYNDGRYPSKDAYANHPTAKYDQNYERYDQKRQTEWDRINQDYDKRIRLCENDRRLSNFERNKRIQQLERERQQRANDFRMGFGHR